MTRVTQAEALERFILERVIGDRPFAVEPDTETCTYDHAAYGGCEIGQYLSAEDAALASGPCSEMAVQNAMRRAEMEMPASEFWLNLQMAHDSLATGEWERFQVQIRDAAETCK